MWTCAKVAKVLGWVQQSLKTQIIDYQDDIHCCIILWLDFHTSCEYKPEKMHTHWKHPTSYSLQLYYWLRVNFPRDIPLIYLLKRFWPRYLDPWPMTLTYELDLDILSPDLHAEIQIRMSVCLAVRVVTDMQTDIRTQATYDLHGRVFLMCYSQWYEGTTNFSYVWKILVNLKIIVTVWPIQILVNL